MASKKKSKKSKKVTKKKAKKTAPARKAVKAKKSAKKVAKKSVKKKAPAKKAPAKKVAAKKAAAKTPVKAKKKAPAKKQIVGEGDYAASRTFLKDQGDFVKKNQAKIPAMGKEAEQALDGPEGAELRAAEAEGKSHAKTGPEE